MLILRTAATAVLCAAMVLPAVAGEPDGATIAGQAATLAAAGAPAARLTLADAVTRALATAERRKIAEAGVAEADARRGQALSSRWPTVSADVRASVMDQAPDFLFPASRFVVPAGTLTTPPITLGLPANAFGPGLPPVAIPLTVPGQTIQIPSQVMEIPAQDVTLMDRTLVTASFRAVYPVYTGGLREARIAQARAGADAARQEQRRAELDTVYDTTRAYYGVVLAGRLREIAADALERMAATMELTESLYKTGSGTVKKTDYLRHKAMVETLRAVAAEVAGQQANARAALAMLVTGDAGATLDVADAELPFTSRAADVAGLVDRASKVNPDLLRIEFGLKAATAGVGAARSGHLPKVGLFVTGLVVGNSYDAGLITDRNRMTWTAGVGVDVPIFEGFRVVHEQAEATAARSKLEHQQALAGQAIRLQVTQAHNALVQSQAQEAAAREAARAAVENRDLNIRAYQDGMVETKDMIESQLIEAVLSAQHARVVYDHLEVLARLDALTGDIPATGR